MSEKDARQRAEKLRPETEHHSCRYDVLDDSEISDAEYDELMAELEAIEEHFPDLATEDSPTREVGAPRREELGGVEHESTMLSLQSVHEEEEEEEFLELVQLR
jgi:DNA ligase (NAD+)